MVNFWHDWLSCESTSVEFPPFALIHRTILQRICGNRDNPSQFRGLAIEIPVTLVRAEFTLWLLLPCDPY